MSVFNWVNNRDYDLSQLKTYKIYLVSLPGDENKKKTHSVSAFEEISLFG